LQEVYSSKINFVNVAQALTEVDTDLRLFGKPDSRLYRRLGVALAKAETTELARAKAFKLASKISLV
jgi:phosphoribosylglycinamide formyltransferase 2